MKARCVHMCHLKSSDSLSGFRVLPPPTWLDEVLLCRELAFLHFTRAAAGAQGPGPHLCLGAAGLWPFLSREFPEASHPIVLS